MLPLIAAISSLLVFLSLFFLAGAIREKPKCSIIITALSAESIAHLLAVSDNAKSNSVYIVTNTYDEKYFNYLEKHYNIREVLTVVDRDT
ncbi:MAG: hypothetical protein IJD97_06735 [Clostridia bacterium]|nr:hypothetical protein [Clostridia bacterium]